MKRSFLLFVFFVLGAWAQTGSARPEAHVASAPAQIAMELTIGAISQHIAVIGSEDRCECPAITPNAQAVPSGTSRFLIAFYVEGTGPFLNTSNPVSVGPATHTRASRFIAGRSVQPPSLLIPRLRQ